MKQIWLFICALLVTSASAKSVALLIGNGDYQHCPKLNNPTHDVKLMAKMLAAGGYQVTQLKDARIQEMTKAVARFCEQAKGAERLLVFYAGHGIEVEGKNFLIPVEAKVANRGDQKWEALSLDYLLGELAQLDTRVKMVVLDCCRDDPFGATRAWRRSRSTGKGGMAAVRKDQLSRGSILVYSGKPGETVPDGPKGENSPFVKAWGKEIKRAAGKSVMSVFVDLGDFLPKQNMHWVAPDNDGSSLALLSRTAFLPDSKKVSVSSQMEGENVYPKVLVEPVFPHFRHHTRGKMASLYRGKFEGNNAYVALSWQSPQIFTGYCFLHEGNTVYYVDGKKVKEGEMDWSVWSKGREIRTVKAQRQQKASKILWQGKTNIGELSFVREKLKRTPYKGKAIYRGQFGIQQATLELQWSDSIEVRGKVKLEGGKVWALVGENSLQGTIFANIYSDTEHLGVALLKKSTFEGVSWSGKCHLNSGQKRMLSVKR